MRPFSYFGLALLLGMTLTGCVKERRGLCPCRLSLDLSRLDTSVVEIARVNVLGPGGYMYDESVGMESFGEEVLINVPKGGCMLCVYSGEQGFVNPDLGLSIPYGEDCPPVYMHASDVEASGESVREVVVMRKNHCRMRINVIGEEYEVMNLILRGVRSKPLKAFTNVDLTVIAKAKTPVTGITPMNIS